MRSTLQRLSSLLGVLVVLALMLVAYRALPPRPFAADDFQWLLGARSLSFGEMLRAAFDPGQEHFYRPLIWLLFWLQARAFDLDPRGYHAVSLALHAANAFLLGWLVCRLQIADYSLQIGPRESARCNRQCAIITGAIVALHPAPFEAVVWVSAQSELLAAFWLLTMLHLWLSATRDRVGSPSWPLHLLATLAFALALLTKESAVIGLPLLVLLSIRAKERRSEGAKERRSQKSAFTLFGFSAFLLLPTLLTFAYLALQVRVERENYVVGEGAYGLGSQLVLNPLRSLALLVAPLPGTERADAAWLVPVGAVVALLLVAWLILTRRSRFAICNLLSALALALTLLPTAPFTSPPDSRYLYMPVLAGAALIGLVLAQDERRTTNDQRPRAGSFVLAGWLVAACLAAFALAELPSRERRFGVGIGAEGSLWRLATSVCAERTPDRVILLNPPIAEVHLRAALELACGDEITPIIVDTMEVAEANLEQNSLIIDFPGGAAHIARQT